MKTAKKIKTLKQIINRLDNQLRAEKKRQRTADTTQKKQLGRLFLLAGVGQFFEEAILPLHQVIQIGAFLIIAGVQDKKRNCVLGALNYACQEANHLDNRERMNQIGINVFEGSKKLAPPLSLVLGIALRAAEILEEDNQQVSLKQRGDYLFTEHQQRQLERRTQQALQSIYHQNKEKIHGNIKISSTA